MSVVRFRAGARRGGIDTALLAQWDATIARRRREAERRDKLRRARNYALALAGGTWLIIWWSAPNLAHGLFTGAFLLCGTYLLVRIVTEARHPERSRPPKDAA